MRKYKKNRFNLTCDTDKDRKDDMLGIVPGHCYAIFDVYCLKKIDDFENKRIDDEEY